MVKNNNEVDINIKVRGKFLNSMIGVSKQLFIFLKVLSKIIYWIIFISTPAFVLYYWNFKYSSEILSYLQVLSWPVLILTIIFIYTDQIKIFLSEMNEFNGWGVSAKRDKISQESSNPVASEDRGENNTTANQIKIEEELDFERIYGVIFRSQLYLLTSLINMGPLSQAYLKDFYSEVQKNNPILRDWTLYQYVNFMFNNKLIELQNDSYKITKKGEKFMNYVVNIRHYVFETKSN